MINSREILEGIQELCIKDAQILAYLQLTNASDADKLLGIVKRDHYADLANNKSRLCVYFRPSRKTSNEIAMQEVLEIDVHVPILRDAYAYDALDRVFNLLHEKEIAYHTFQWDGQLGSLPTAQNYYCAGYRFTCNVTTKSS